MSNNPQLDRAIADVLASLDQIIPEPPQYKIDSGFYVITASSHDDESTQRERMRQAQVNAAIQAAKSRQLHEEQKQREQQAQRAMDAAWNAFIENAKKLLSIAVAAQLDTSANPLNKLRALSQADRKNRDSVNALATDTKEWVYGLEAKMQQQLDDLFLPASWYAKNTGVTSDDLRKAVSNKKPIRRKGRDGELIDSNAPLKAGDRPLYSYRDVERQFPGKCRQEKNPTATTKERES